MAKAEELVTTIRKAQIDELDRLDRRIGRADASGYEAYGRVKAAMDIYKSESGNITKLPDETWKEVVNGTPESVAAMLRENERQALKLACQLVEVAALARRGAASVLGDWEPPVDVDEETGEVVAEAE